MTSAKCMSDAEWEGVVPKNRTAVTERMMAVMGSTSLSKKIGSASIAAAFTSSNVTSSRCGRRSTYSELPIQDNMLGAKMCYILL